MLLGGGHVKVFATCRGEMFDVAARAAMPSQATDVAKGFARRDSADEHFHSQRRFVDHWSG